MRNAVRLFSRTFAFLFVWMAVWAPCLLIAKPFLNVVALDRLTMNPCVEAHLSVRQRDQRHVQKRTRT